MQKNWRTPVVVLLAGALIVNFSLGIRHGMGLFQLPITGDLGFTRESFGFALAVQNICWGVSTPLLGMVADKHGAGRVIFSLVSSTRSACGGWNWQPHR